MRLQHIFLIILGIMALEACQMVAKPIPPPGSETPPGFQQITDTQRQALQGLFTTLVDRKPENCEAMGLRQLNPHEHSSADLMVCVSQNSGEEGVFEKVVLDERLGRVQIHLNSKYYVYGLYHLQVYLPEIFQGAILQPSSSENWMDGERYTGHVEAYDFGQRRITVTFYSRYVDDDGVLLERIEIMRWPQVQTKRAKAAEVE